MYKQIQWGMVAALGLFSPAVLALGLGGAVVESYLDQPLDVRIELISQSSDELESITAGLASVEDFELLGLSRAAVAVPLEFEIVADAAEPHIRVTSRLTVSEPVVQVLVEVVWASGRMLREYTLFLDPPTVDSQAPPVLVAPAGTSARADLSRPESATPPPAAVQRAAVTEAPKPAERVSAAEEPQAEEIVREQQRSEEVVLDDAGTEEERLTESDDSEPSSETETEEEPALYQQDEVYGPVASGETLWGIARDFSRGSGYSINQAMLALQRKNPEAFIQNNINSLKRGAILRLPAFSEIGELSTREALVEVIRQEEEARSGFRSVTPDFTTPTVADSGDYQESVAEETAEPDPEEDQGHLELVPPAEEDSESLTDSVQVEDEGVSADVIQQELARTEEELVNAQQENTYLTQRIEELEAEVQAQAERSMAVENTDLANLETRLAEERASGEPDTPVAITPGGEEQAWYKGKTIWIVAIAILLIALIIWGLRRKIAGRAEAEHAVAVQAIAVEAEDILRTLDTEDEGETVVQPAPEPKPGLRAVPDSEPDPEPETELEAEQEPVSEAEPEQVSEQEPEQEPVLEPGSDDGIRMLDMDEEATVVQLKPEFQAEPADDSGIGFADEDEGPEPEDDDPEIKLDLARAYLSLGDKEASKSMLDEVLKSGSDEQKAEARQMLDEL